MQRRIFLKTSLAAAEYTLLLNAGLLTPRMVLADWPADAFHAGSLDEAMLALAGGQPVVESDDIELDVPSIVEDGRSVPVSVRSHYEGTDTISLFSEKNPNPAVGTFALDPALEPRLDTRIKMGGSGFVIALVGAKGKFYRTSKRARVTSGGCA
ncbi:MAG: thiosulfate oxidation carrier protein SoxY [Pseudomonadota bacterium]